MNSFPYKATVIVPAYNVSEYLEKCLNSLVNQTISKDKIEVLVINDGSTDNTLEIANEIAARYDFIHVYSKENEGLSATRNYGIKRAQGKYIFYLDSDDYLTEPTIEVVTDFFDEVYDEVDLVSYLLYSFSDNRITSVHYKYTKVYKERGVYDLEENPYIAHTNVNVCVKNLGPDNHLFHSDRYFRQEDQEYNNRVLMDKMKIGYCPEGVYMYNRGNENSLVHTLFNAYYMFERSTKYFEDLFACFDGPVPRYFQAMYLNDLNYKLTDNFLYPFHYEGEKFKQACDRLITLLNRVDVELIANHPMISNYHKQYWIAQKENANPVPIIFDEKAGILCNGRLIYRNHSGIEIRVQNLTDDGNILHFRGHLKSPLFNYTEAPVLYIAESEEKGIIIKPDHYVAEEEEEPETEVNLPLREVALFDSSFSYMNNLYVKTNPCYAFDCSIDVSRIKEFAFFVGLRGEKVRTYFTFARQTGFVPTNKIPYTMIIRGKIKVEYDQKAFAATLLSAAEVVMEQRVKTEGIRMLNLRNELKTKTRDLYGMGVLPTDFFDVIVDEAQRFSAQICDYREQALVLKKEKRIWLYYDLYTVLKDNGYYQFVNDFKHDDGIERYYVYDRELEDIEHLFTDEQRKHLVRFGSDEHCILYLASELILTGFYGYSTISPFQDEDLEIQYDDIKTFRVIYLQHGVLHASLRKQNSVENYRADKIVISSWFEKQNYVENYHYNEDDLICTGMARYDYIHRDTPAQRKILFAPSWREYFTVRETASKWNVFREKLLSSDYYKKFNALISSPELAEILEKNNCTFEIKMHPIISELGDVFTYQSDHIRMADAEVNVDEYCMFITDYSSYVFDYAYLNRPIMYFVPDYEQFRSGMGHYKDLDLPFEKAFGPLVLEAKDAVAQIKRIAEQNFKTDDVYSERMENFFFDFGESAAEGTYRQNLEYVDVIRSK